MLSCVKCSGEHGAIEMSFSEVQPEKLAEPPLTMNDFMAVVHNTRSSVSQADLLPFEEWTAEYGQDGSGASGQRGETIGRSPPIGVDPSGAAIGEPATATAAAAATATVRLQINHYPSRLARMDGGFEMTGPMICPQTRTMTAPFNYSDGGAGAGGGGGGAGGSVAGLLQSLVAGLPSAQRMGELEGRLQTVESMLQQLLPLLAAAGSTSSAAAAAGQGGDDGSQQQQEQPGSSEAE